jgi:nicotinamidase-related amidase
MDPLEALKVAMASVDRYYRERGIFGGRFGFGETPALVVIDMANGWTDPSYAGGSRRLDTAVAAIARLLALAREQQVPVFYTTAASDQPQAKTASEASPNFRPWDRHASEIDDRLRPAAGEPVFPKEHASAFAGTPLVGHLIANRVDTLLITGCSTSACIRATATDAKSLNLRPIIIREAVQDRSEIAHEWTLFDIQARFADVIGVDEALEYLRGLPAGAPAAVR